LGVLNKFTALSLERKFLVLFIVICVALPFSMAGVAFSSWETFLYAIPLWIYFQGGVSLWFTSGKPLWQAVLACYGVSTFELLGIYFGTFGIRLLFQKVTGWFRKPLKQNNSGLPEIQFFYQKQKKQFINWLEKQSTWIILIFLFLPLPITDILAAITLGTRGLKYGHWYLTAVNLPHIFLIVYLLKLGVTFLFL